MPCTKLLHSNRVRFAVQELWTRVYVVIFEYHMAGYMERKRQEFGDGWSILDVDFSQILFFHRYLLAVMYWPFLDSAAQCLYCPSTFTARCTSNVCCVQNTRLLSQFVSPYTGRIYGRQITGLCLFMQRRVARLIKRSRFFGAYRWPCNCVYVTFMNNIIFRNYVRHCGKTHTCG